MPASNTKIKKICEWCGTRFEAQKISTKYCSHRCANLAYKKREREKNIKARHEPADRGRRTTERRKSAYGGGRPGKWCYLWGLK